MDKVKRKRLSQAEIDSLVQETVSKAAPRAATVTLPKPPKAVGASPEPPAPMRPLTAALDETLASIQATVIRLDERLAKTERAFGGFEKQINALETSLVAERQARDEQARAIGQIKAIAEDSQVDSLQAKVSELSERLGKAEGAFNGFEKQLNTVETSLVAERQARDKQVTKVSELNERLGKAEGVFGGFESKMNAVAGGSQVDALRDRLNELNERLERAEKYLSGFEKQTADILASLSADRAMHEEQSRLASEMKTVVDGLCHQSAPGELTGLNERIAELEANMDRSEQYRKALETSLMANRQMQLAQSQAINTQLKTITQGLRNTLAYDMKKNFKCDCCGADGAVALKIKCTHCDKENWWGWWPKDNK